MRNSSRYAPANIVLSDVYKRFQGCHAALDIERAVVGVCLVPDAAAGVVFDQGLDGDCFWDDACREIFFAAKDCLVSKGVVSLDAVSEKTGFSVEYLTSLEGNPAHVEYHIKILRVKKIQRAVIGECYHLLEMASDESVDIDSLLERCGDLQRRILFGKPAEIFPVRTADNDYFVYEETGERFKVIAGKEGRPDFCVVDGKFVSEPKMLRNGFVRITDKDYKSAKGNKGIKE